MSHQKLLDKLAYTPHTDPNGKNMYQALRAVMELHRPIKRPKWLPIEFQGDSCNLCPGSYPCPTIKAIDKELA